MKGNFDARPVSARQEGTPVLPSIQAQGRYVGCNGKLALVVRWDPRACYNKWQAHHRT